MARKNIEQPPKPPLRLTIPTADARDKLAERIEKGQELLALQIDSQAQLEQLKKEYSKWSAYNVELLKQMFSDESMSKEYSFWGGFAVVGGQSFGEEVEEFYSDVEEKIHRLESISERLELIPVAEDAKGLSDKPSSSPTIGTTKVFIVHGHDEAVKELTARFLQRLELKPIILHEQSSGGRTIIEKIEHYSDVGYAVVLLTPDDEGRAKSEEEVYHDRARQNVLLELGYCMGKLGRNRVCALHRGGVEIPTDYSGVLYVPFDEAGGWRLELAKELKAAGLDIDMNNAV